LVTDLYIGLQFQGLSCRDWKASAREVPKEKMIERFVILQNCFWLIVYH